MSQILLTLSIPGAILLFVLIKTGMRLIFPFAICVILGLLGMVVFIWASADPIAPNDPEFAINPISVAAAFVTGAAAFGVLLLGVVVIARWISGEYQSVKKGHDT